MTTVEGNAAYFQYTHTYMVVGGAGLEQTWRMRVFRALGGLNLKLSQFTMEDIIDPKYEYDAPVYVDFATVALDLVEDDNADKWFGKTKENDFCLLKEMSHGTLSRF